MFLFLLALTRPIKIGKMRILAQCAQKGEPVHVKTAKNIGIMALCAGLGTALFALGYYAGVFLLMIVALFIPMVFVYLRARTNNIYTVLGIVLFGVPVFLMAGINYAGIMMCCSLPVALVIGYLIAPKTTFYYSVLFSCVAMLASLGILLLCVQLFFQVSLVELVQQKFAAELAATPAAEAVARQSYYLLETAQSMATGRSTAMDANTVMAMPIEEVVDGVMRFVDPYLALTIPTAAAFCVPAFGLLNYIVPRAAAKKAGVEVGDIPTFSAWSLPKGFGIWSLVLLILAFIGEAAGWHNFDLVYSIAIGFLTAIYSVQGMAFIDWLLKKKMESGAGRAAIIVATFLLLSFINLYMWIGFFEQVVKLRKRELAEHE